VWRPYAHTGVIPPPTVQGATGLINIWQRWTHPTTSLTLETTQSPARQSVFPRHPHEAQARAFQSRNRLHSVSASTLIQCIKTISEQFMWGKASHNALSYCNLIQFYKYLTYLSYYHCHILRYMLSTGTPCHVRAQKLQFCFNSITEQIQGHFLNSDCFLTNQRE
jgi:hypothetical protein